MSLIDKLPKKLTQAVGKLWLKTTNASPEICLIGGIACGAGALILVGVNTWKHKERLNADLDAIRPYTTEFVPVTEEEEKKLSKKQIKKIVTDPDDGKKYLPVPLKREKRTDWMNEQLMARRIDFTKDILKTYGVPVILEVASGVLIWKGRTILRDKLSAMTAAYAALSEAYRKYCNKNVDEQTALGYDVEEHVDENGKVEKVIKPNANGGLNPFGFWLNDGFYDENGNTIWRNNVWCDHCRDKNQLIFIVKQEQEQSTRELRTIGYWRLENTMLRRGMPPKEAAKFHDYGKVAKAGEENLDSIAVLEDDDQLEVNQGFIDSFSSQNICYINPNVDGYIGYINDELEKYDMRYGFSAQKELPYKSFNREANRLIERHHQEQMERMIFNSMSDSGKRRMAKILK